MSALVIAPVALPWPLFLVASLFTLIALVAVAKESGKRIAAALLIAAVLATPAILRAEDDVVIPNPCILMPWLIECWCPICV